MTRSFLELDSLEQHEAICTLVSVDIRFGTSGDHLLVQRDMADIVRMQRERLLDQPVTLRLFGLDLDAVGLVIQLWVL